MTSKIDNIIDIVSGKVASDRKALAVEILRYITQEQAMSAGKPDSDRRIDNMLLENAVSNLWGGYDRLQTVKNQDGIERLTRVKVDAKPVIAGEPAPGPMPQFEPAVPLPVIPPTDTEMLARKESFATLEERYSDQNIAVRVKAVEDAAAELRAMRDQPTPCGSGATPVITAASIPPSAEEQRAVAGITITSPSDDKIAAIQQDGVKPLTSVESIEAQIEEERSVQEKYAAAQANLVRLKALRQAS